LANMCLRKDGLLLLMYREKWKMLLNLCRDMHLKHSAQNFEQPPIY